ncbi:HNH endonuclease [Arthrobacter phage Conboy]|uniref:HNH endonuclease n=1 Tax=Arthrobacter phage Conboy TaxID=1873902 RepID=A0A1B1SGA2_9CAUD|nr:HNH endonuclease [Arthrobacter phage Conboy]
MPRKTTPALERFWAKVDKREPQECWPWTAAKTAAREDYQYGALKVGGRVVRANRFALELKLGRPLGPGMKARHTCDNPPCCNPAHLLEGTQAQNLQDMHDRGRHPYKRKRQEHGR